MDVLKDFLIKQVEVAQVETADKSVYLDLVQEIGRLKVQVEHQSNRPNKEIRGEIPGPQKNNPHVPQRMQAWNSSGGTIEARNKPNMGAPKSFLRIPNKGLFSILEYSEHSIMLDGQKTRFVLVEVNGEKGWTLENYLNFN